MSIPLRHNRVWRRSVSAMRRAHDAFSDSDSSPIWTLDTVTCVVNAADHVFDTIVANDDAVSSINLQGAAIKGVDPEGQRIRCDPDPLSRYHSACLSSIRRRSSS
jgi:hypothetical protein